MVFCFVGASLFPLLSCQLCWWSGAPCLGALVSTCRISVYVLQPTLSHSHRMHSVCSVFRMYKIPGTHTKKGAAFLNSLWYSLQPVSLNLISQIHLDSQVSIRGTTRSHSSVVGAPPSSDTLFFLALLNCDAYPWCASKRWLQKNRGSGRHFGGWNGKSSWGLFWVKCHSALNSHSISNSILGSYTAHSALQHSEWFTR